MTRHEVFPGSRPGEMHAAFMPSADGSGFYLCGYRDLWEFDAKGRAVRVVRLGRFRLPGQRGGRKADVALRFGGDAANVKGRIWLTVRPEEAGLGGVSSGLDAFLVGWRPSDAPASRRVWRIPTEASFPMVVDGLRERAYFPQRSLSVDLSSGKTTKHSWGEYAFADLDPRRGLLLSTCPGDQTRRIIRVDLASGGAVTIAKGHRAVWGCDGHVYFARGYTQLWRCERDGKNAAAVYAVTPRVTVREDDAISTSMIPWISGNRAFLGLSYWVREAGDKLPPCRTILIDIKRKQYRELDCHRDFLGWVLPSAVKKEPNGGQNGREDR